MKYIVGALILLSIGGGLWWHVHGKTSVISTTTNASLPGDKPWIEVVTDSAIVTDSSEATTTAQTGDEVTVGSNIQTNATGVVLVHFADGSFAQLDPNSSITITEADYDASSGASNVHVSLATGTLWSKVLDLVGINSSWEVTTSNAVATVRGTSFVTFASKGKTRVAGIEHAVSVQPLEPHTHQHLATSTQTNVTANAQVTIEDAQIPTLASGKTHLATMAAVGISTDATYKTFEKREKNFDSLRDSLNAKLGNGPEFRKEFRASQVKDFQNQILERRTKFLEPRTQNTAATTTNPGTTTPKTTTPPVTTTPAPTAHPVSLSVTSDQDLRIGLTDGDTATFHAILVFSDGTKKDVTSSVKWNVINNIGVFPTPGTFHAQLSANAAELGTVPGAIYATFTGTDGKELNAPSPAFNIHAFVSAQTTTNG